MTFIFESFNNDFTVDVKKKKMKKLDKLKFHADCIQRWFSIKNVDNQRYFIDIFETSDVKNENLHQNFFSVLYISILCLLEEDVIVKSCFFQDTCRRLRDLWYLFIVHQLKISKFDRNFQTQRKSWRQYHCQNFEIEYFQWTRLKRILNDWFQFMWRCLKNLCVSRLCDKSLNVRRCQRREWQNHQDERERMTLFLNRLSSYSLWRKEFQDEFLSNFVHSRIHRWLIDAKMSRWSRIRQVWRWFKI